MKNFGNTLVLLNGELSFVVRRGSSHYMNLVGLDISSEERAATVYSKCSAPAQYRRRKNLPRSFSEDR